MVYSLTLLFFLIIFGKNFKLFYFLFLCVKMNVDDLRGASKKEIKSQLKNITLKDLASILNREGLRDAFINASTESNQAPKKIAIDLLAEYFHSKSPLRKSS